MKNLQTKLSSRDDFFAALQHGADGLILAGKILLSRVDANPNECREIIIERPSLSLNVLDTLIRIGRGELLPELAMDNSPGACRVRSLPVSEQRRIQSSPVKLIILDRGKKVVVEKPIQQLTPSEIRTVFDGNRILTPEEQIAKIGEGNQPKLQTSDRYHWTVAGIVLDAKCSFTFAELEDLAAQGKQRAIQSLKK